MKVEFCPGTCISQTWDKINTLIKRIKAIRPLNYDQLKTAVAIKALGRHYENLQLTIQSITKQLNFLVNNVTNCLLEEDDHICNCEAQGLLPVATALAAQATTPATCISGNWTRPTCSHCKRTGHYANFCIQPGGKMAGCSLKEVMAAYHTLKGKCTDNQPQSSSANIAIVNSNTSTSANATNNPPFVINRVQHIPMPTASSTTPSTDTALSTLTDGGIMPLDTEFKFHCRIAHIGDHHISLDWNQHSNVTILNNIPSTPIALSAMNTPSNMQFDSPFFLDTGANTHLSLVLSDFKTLHLIAPHLILGIGGSCIHAVSIGSIEIPVSASHKFTLINALYAPTSKVHLISMLTLNCSGHNVSHFDENGFWVTNTGGETILHGSVNEACRLYCFDPYNAHRTQVPSSGNPTPMNAPTSALYTLCTPDVETWHCYLGYCSTKVIINMAQKKAIKGMSINLSSSPPKCEACILGKQMGSTVPKMREGERASRPLKCMFIDLCGSICPVSSSGRIYSMNVIDNFSSYVWSLPLRSKGDASSILQLWHHAIINQSKNQLQTLITNNGELVSNTMVGWYAQYGIDHRCTAPYTSAQNGWAERLHQTLLKKACAMLLSCKGPAEFWDEFCATVAYLTNLMATTSLQGHTPFELWFGWKLSLSHLRKISCCTFALIPMTVSKSFTHSHPCILIGYFSHSKAYHIWDPTLG